MSDANLDRYLEQPDPELESMISGERAIPAPTQGQRERVWKKLELVLPPNESAANPESSAGAAATKGFAAKALLSGVSAIVGGVIALSVERQLVTHTEETPSAATIEVRPPEPLHLPRSAPTPVVAPSPSAPSAAIPAPRAVVRERIATAIAPENSAASETGLREEQSWIATMRAGLVRREFDEVARRAREYQVRFPEGQLQEDCDALALLAGLNRDPQRATATDVERFFARYPTSLYRAAIVRAQQGAQH